MQKDRRSKIEEIMNTTAYVHLRDLTEIFPEVSEMTLRRDIDYFEKLGKVVKVRGGFRSVGSIRQADVDKARERDKNNIEAKEEIASVAAKFLEIGTSIFIDSGSTMRTFSKFVPNYRYALTTTDPAVAIELCKNDRASVNIVGGRIDSDNKTVTGLQASRFLSGINIDTAFLSASAFSENFGFSVAGYNECELKKIVISKARRIIMLIDSSKYGKNLPYTFCALDDADIIITDKKAPLELPHIAARRGTEVLIAGKK